MKETINKKLFVGVLSLVVVGTMLAGYLAYFGEAVLFATTNRAEVLAEKARWDAYIKAYPNE